MLTREFAWEIDMIGRTFFHYVGVVTGLQQPATQTTPAEREVLCAHLPDRKRIVEIGVFEGFTTQVLAERSDPDAVIYGVDPFFSGRLGISWGEKIAVSYNSQHLASGKLKFVRRLSTEVADEVPSQVDYVFIDADHSLQGITADWAHWSERLAPGGIIALHDTLLTPDKPAGYVLGSIIYFGDHIQHDRRFEIVQQKDSLSVLKKR